VTAALAEAAGAVEVEALGAAGDIELDEVARSAIRSGGSKVNLKSMSIDKLSKLATLLRTKVADERRILQAELVKLSRFSTSELHSKGR
jgi:hypothetical protein